MFCFFTSRRPGRASAIPAWNCVIKYMCWRGPAARARSNLRRYAGSSSEEREGGVFRFTSTFKLSLRIQVESSFRVCLRRKGHDPASQ